MNKSEYIIGLIELSPRLSTNELAAKAQCTPQLVNLIKRGRRPSDSVIGVISDTHIPAVHPGYFEFIQETFRAWGVNKIVHIGDLVDFHQASRHVSEPNSMSVLDELEAAKKELKKWTQEFPDVNWCAGNHDAIPVRQAKELGIPKAFMKSLHDLLDIPKTWIKKSHHIIDDCYFEHGLGSGGMYGAKNTSLKYRMNYIQGHTHANAGVYYSSGPKDTVFGLNVGCGCDTTHVSQSYGVDYKSKVTLGCGIVKNGKEGYFVPMT